MLKDKALQYGEYAAQAVIAICGVIGAIGFFSREIMDWRIAVPVFFVFWVAAFVYVKIIKARAAMKSGHPNPSTSSVDNP